MSIVSSTFTEGPRGDDGRRQVLEIHTASDGRSFEFEWLGEHDAQTVANVRVPILNAQLDTEAAVLALVAGTKLPLTPLDFRRRFPLAARQAVDEFNENFRTDDRLTPAQKRAIRTTLIDLQHARGVRIEHPDTIRGVQMYVTLGVINQAQADEILYDA